MSNPTINDIKNATAAAAAQNQARQSRIPVQEAQSEAQSDASDSTSDSVIASLAISAQQAGNVLKSAEAQTGAALSKQAIRGGEKNAVIAEMARSSSFLKTSARLRAKNAVQIVNFINQVEAASESELIELLADDHAFDDCDIAVELGKLAEISGDPSDSMLVLSI